MRGEPPSGGPPCARRHPGCQGRHRVNHKAPSLSHRGVTARGWLQSSVICAEHTDQAPKQVLSCQSRMLATVLTALQLIASAGGQSKRERDFGVEMGVTSRLNLVQESPEIRSEF